MKDREGQTKLNMILKNALLLLLCSFIKSEILSSKKPNIVFIVADDLGWDDVSFHGSPQIPTPNIDSLAKSGVILNNYYVSPSSFATKTEFMTGKYATHLGTQHGVLHNKQPFGLPHTEKILPQYLKEAGYNNYAVGKWALGYYKEEMLPWKRGFDFFYGGLTSSGKDYYTHSAFDENYGLDLRRNNEVIHNETGNYITEVYTREAVNIIKNYNDNKPLFLYVAHQAVHTGNADDPLQAPESYLKKLNHIKNIKRKLFAGMVLALDESVLNITIALAQKGLLDNTVIVFTTNAGGAVGGQELSSASNFPLRGSKLTVWEGGIRAVAFVYSDLIKNKGRVSLEMYHSTDWLLTALGLAGINTKGIKVDGFDVWKSISEGEVSPRFEILHQFDPLAKNLCSLRVGDYKLVINQDIGFYGDWYPRPAEIGELRYLKRIETLPNAKVTCDKNYPHPFLEMHAPPCDPIKKPCMFNIQWDPCEFHNLAEFMPNTLKVLLDRLQFYRLTLVKPIYPSVDSQADPENSDGVWSPWVNSSIASMNFHQQQPTIKLDTPNTNKAVFNGNQMTVNNKESTEVNLPAQTSNNVLEKTVQVTATTSPPLYSIMDQVVTPLILGPGLMVNSANESRKIEPTILLSNNQFNQFETSPQIVSDSGFGTTQPPPKLITSYLVKNISEYESPAESNVVNYVLNSSTPSFVDQIYNNNINKDFTTIVNNEVPNQKTSSVIQSTNAPTEKSNPNNLVLEHFDDVNKASKNIEDSSFGIQIINRNASKQLENSRVHLTDNELQSINKTGKIDMVGKTTEVYVVQNQNSLNPLQTNLVEDNLSLNKNISKVVTSVTNDGLFFNTINNVASVNQNKLVLESGNQNKLKTTIPPIIDYNDITGQGKTGKNLGYTPSSGITPSAILPSQTVPVVNGVTNKVVEQGAVSITPEMIHNPIEPSYPEIVTEAKLPPAEKYLPLSASLRPENKNEKLKTGSASKGSLSLGSGSETSTSTETEVSANSLTEAKTDSKLPALQKPYILANLKNIADAGSSGKTGLSSEVALLTGSDLGPGKVQLPSAQNFIKEPEYQSITKPDFDKPQNPFKQGGSSSRMSAGSSAGGGSETETETVVGAGASTGSGTKIGTNQGNKGPRVKPKNFSAKGSAKLLKQKNTPENNNAEKYKLSSLKNSKGLKSSLNPLAGHELDSSDFSLLNLQQSNFPNAVIAGYRPFQSVNDVISDSANQMCGESRNCISKMPIINYQEATEPEEKVKLYQNKSSGIEIHESQNIFRSIKAGIRVTESGDRTQATSNQLPVNNNQQSVAVNNSQNKTSNWQPKLDEAVLNGLPAQEKLHKFFGEIKVDNKKMFFISGTASEDKDLVYTQTDSSGLLTQNDVRKHNIGFNVVLPSNIVKQLSAPESLYTPKSRVENATKTQGTLHNIGEKTSIHQKNKPITKVFDSVADTARSRKMKVESPPVEENLPGIRGNIETINVEVMGGMNGDIGATKPLKGGLGENRKLSDDFVKSEIINVTDNVIEAKIEPSSNIDAGDLGSIVTLVGKVKVDRLSSKHMKGSHNITKENNAHKKTVKDHMSVKQPKLNSSTETNAANINSLKGPTNSFIVSSVIVVLLASFVVVGMAVVAVVAVVARHCRVAKHFDAS
ncbi:serine-rich adhesin for platelets isoform X2 [Hydra vulgaris]|uniref:Serine-rich adhesin for platelets isoform X2 n=1 Tax=Hydra vulgaris TaxID=6087 RepID=A0ABM4BCF0_HYDVU